MTFVQSNLIKDPSLEKKLTKHFIKKICYIILLKTFSKSKNIIKHTLILINLLLLINPMNH